MHAEANTFEGSERIPCTWIKGTQVLTGTPVQLRPSGSADILELTLRGKSAVVESIEVDFEGKVFVSVVLDDDPGRELGRLGQPGHRFYFRAEEVEPILASRKESP